MSESVLLCFGGFRVGQRPGLGERLSHQGDSDVGVSVASGFSHVNFNLLERLKHGSIVVAPEI